MKKLMLLLLLIVCSGAAYFLYVDRTPPVIFWGVDPNDHINDIVKINIKDDRQLSEVCFSMAGGACPGEERCTKDIQAQSFDLLIDPETCLVRSEPLDIELTINALDSSFFPNQATGSITLTFDNQPPTLSALSGTRYLKRGGAGVVLYEVGESPVDTGIMLDDLQFKAFPLHENRYISFYAHPYYVAADDFKPRIFAIDPAGNLRKIRPGSFTAAQSYKSEEIVLSDSFLESVKDKMLATSTKSPLDAFLEVNDQLRKENQQMIVEICRKTEPRQLWAGVFLRNPGAPKAGFAEQRAYKYGSEIVSRQVHTGIDIAGVNNNEIIASNHGKVVFTGEIGIYGNVVVLDHGYGLHSLYGHLSQISVQEGDSVTKGQTIALSGETGLAFGDHLHFEIRVNGVPVNPIEWFDDAWISTHIAPFMAEAKSL